MKKIKLIVMLFVAAFATSCSPETDPDPTPPIAAIHFDFTYDGEAKIIAMTGVQATKKENLIAVSGTTSDGININFKFNKNGSLYTAGVTAAPLTIQSSLYNNNIGTFLFELVELNETDKTIHVNYNGQVYEDDYNNASPYKVVSGSFKVAYTDVTPTEAGFGTTMKINGGDWIGIGLSSTSSVPSNTNTINIANGSGYKIGIVYPYDALPALGTTSFINTSIKKIAFSKYDSTIHAFVDYNVSGTITFTEANATYIQGTYSLTASHPTNGVTYTVTTGVFKEARSY